MSLDIEENGLQDVYISEFYKGLDCARSLTCEILYRSGEFKQLVELGFRPQDYNDLETARSSLAATKFLSKATFLDTGNDVDQIALDKFKAAELTCKETNERIVRNKFENTYSAGVLMHMRLQIERILGSLDAEEFVDSCNWGPGATTLLPRRTVSNPKKFSSERKISRSAYDFVAPWFHIAYPQWEMMFEIDGTSKIVTVPKDAKGSRTIAIEPGINLWFQKGIGSMLRKRLKWVGIDLNDQSHNQKKAKLGSIFNDTATIDFSSASDTISYELVREAIPLEWFCVMNSFRSEVGVTKAKEKIYFSKFSSMGNGFTFELESLLFYTMAVACCDVLGVSSSAVSVYGDDVILPSCVYDLYHSVSRDLGFTFNLTKSYKDSFYRESCGEHYWQGVSIKPIFQKEPINEKTSLILAANNVRRLARSRRNGGCDLALRRCYQLLANSLGPKCPRISEGYGDYGLIENFDESYVERPGNGYEGFFVRVWALRASQLDLSSLGLFLFRVKAAGSSKSMVPQTNSLGYHSYGNLDDLETLSAGNKIACSSKVRLSRERLLIPRWLDLGPWC